VRQRLTALSSLLLLAACSSPTVDAPEQLNDPGPHDASYDGALEFDGLDDFASVGTARLPAGVRDQTVLFWFKPHGALSGKRAGVQVMFSMLRAEVSGYGLALSEANEPITYKVYGDKLVDFGAKSVELDVWHHLAFVIQSEPDLEKIPSTLFIDGVQVGMNVGGLTKRTPTQAFIGSLNGFDFPFHGELDDLRVYDRVFDPEEIASAAAGMAPGDNDPSVLYLPFDEASGSRAYDRSGLDNHAELGDGVWSLMPTRVRH